MEIGYSKEKQLGKVKEKKESTFGKRPSRGTFGKKPTVWNKKGKNLKPKVKKFDLIDDEYSKWLGTQPCCITGLRANRGVGYNEIHCHHIHGRTPIRNDYKQVPLIGFLHSWGDKAYHSNTKQDFIKKNKLLLVDDIIVFFEDMTTYYLEEYKKIGGVIKTLE